MSARTHVSSVLPSCNMTTVPIRRVTEKERTTEEEKKKKKKKKANNRIGFNSPDRYLNRWSKSVCVCACILSLSLFLFHAYARAIFVFFFYSLRRPESNVCKHTCTPKERKKRRGLRYMSVNITKSKKKPENSISKKTATKHLTMFLLCVETNE